MASFLCSISRKVRKIYPKLNLVVIKSFNSLFIFIKIGKTLSIYGVVSFLFNIIIFAFISLLLINNNNALYIVLFGFIANMVLPLPFLYYIKRHNYDEITNKFEIKNKIPWGTGIIITIVYYVLSVVFMPNIPNNAFDGKTALISIGFGIFMTVVFYFIKKTRIAS